MKNGLKKQAEIQENFRFFLDFNLGVVGGGVVHRTPFAWVAWNSQNIGLKHFDVFADACDPFAEFLRYRITVFIALFLVQHCQASSSERELDCQPY